MFTIKRTLRRRSTLAVAAALVITVAACSDDSDPQTAQTSSDADSLTTTVPEDGQDADETGGDVETGETNDDGNEPPPDEPPDEVLATVQGTAPWGQLEITDMRRVEDHVIVDFALLVADDVDTGELPSGLAAAEDRPGNDEDKYSVSGMALVDRQNQKRHLVLRDSNGACLCTSFGDIGFLESGERLTGSAEFPAPPGDVAELSVEMPSFPVADNVPLRQG